MKYSEIINLLHQAAEETGAAFDTGTLHDLETYMNSNRQGQDLYTPLFWLYNPDVSSNPISSSWSVTTYQMRLAFFSEIDTDVTNDEMVRQQSNAMKKTMTFIRLVSDYRTQSEGVLQIGPLSHSPLAYLSSQQLIGLESTFDLKTNDYYCDDCT